MPPLPLAVRIHQYLRTLAPHMREREAAILLAEAEDELDRISEQSFIEQARAAIMGGWIPVSERLPLIDGDRVSVNVICAHGEVIMSPKYGRIDTGRCEVSPSSYLGCDKDGPCFRSNVNTRRIHATHWMPLPEPPEEV